MKTPKATDPIYLKLFDMEPSKRDLKSIEIILAAIACMADQGIEATTFDSIAKKLKIGPSHVAYYFPTKSAIIEAAIKFSLGSVQDITVANLLKAKSDKSQMEAIARSVFEWGRRYPQHVSVFILFHHLCTFDKDRRDLHTSIRKVGRDRIIQVLNESAHASRLPENELEQLGHQVQVLILGRLFECFVANNPLSLEQQEEQTVREVLLLVKDFL